MRNGRIITKGTVTKTPLLPPVFVQKKIYRTVNLYELLAKKQLEDRQRARLQWLNQTVVPR